MKFRLPLFFGLLLLLVIAGCLRFYKLDWGEGYFLHPDERNVASAVLNLNPQTGDYNPDFFAYGAWPIYLLRALAGNNFEAAILWGRKLSALLSTLLVLLIFFTTYGILNHVASRIGEMKKFLWSFWAAVLLTFTPGMVQFAHFMTYEMLLSFLYFVLFIFSLCLFFTRKNRFYYLISLTLGLAISAKLSSIVFLAVPVAVQLLLSYPKTQKSFFKKLWSWFLHFWGLHFILSFLLIFELSLMFSPFNVWDYKGFRDSMNYEGGIAVGQMVVFYTQQYLNTFPVFYQIIHIFPYSLGVGMTLLWVIMSFVVLIAMWKTRRFLLSKVLFLLVVFISCYLVSNFSLFLKWTRYMMPIFPFLVLLVVLGMVYLFEVNKKIFSQKLKISIILVITLFQIFQTLDFTSIYMAKDCRIQASEWAKKNINPESKRFVEDYEIGMIVMNEHIGSQNTKSINFYDLDMNANVQSPLRSDFDMAVAESEYFLSLSPRVYASRLRLANEYPLVSSFYKGLFSGTNGYHLAYSCNPATLTEKLFPDFNLYNLKKLIPNYWNEEDSQNSKWWQNILHQKFYPDETFYVFDHPTVLIFKKDEV